MFPKIENGMALVEKYFHDYTGRAIELRKEGKHILGYLCAYVPLEIIHAADFVPFRIKGDINEPISKADAQMETIVCPLVRSCFDMTLKKKYDFLEGLVIPHACDSMCKTYDIWKYTTGLPYTHLINMPHSTDDSSLEFYKEILNTFKISLEKYSGINISREKLHNAITIYNSNRALIRELMKLRGQTPPLISGTELLKVLIAILGIPVQESVELLKSVINEVKHRNVIRKDNIARIMVVGAEVDNTAIFELIEDIGACVVADDLCPGAREFQADIQLTDNPIDGIAERYLRKIYCGRTYRERKGTYSEYLEERFGHIGRSIRDFNVNGVIVFLYKYCDPFGFEVPAIKKYIESLGIPMLYLENSYSMSTIAALRTRIQAFIEIIS